MLQLFRVVAFDFELDLFRMVESFELQSNLFYIYDLVVYETFVVLVDCSDLFEYI